MNKDKFRKDGYVINQYLKINSKTEAPYFQSTDVKGAGVEGGRAVAT